MSAAATAPSISSRARATVAIIASADVNTRSQIGQMLRRGRWKVNEACGGAEALALLESEPAEALIVDQWLPDLEVREFLDLIATMFPDLELIRIGETEPALSGRSTRYSELRLAVQSVGQAAYVDSADSMSGVAGAHTKQSAGLPDPVPSQMTEPQPFRHTQVRMSLETPLTVALPDMVGGSSAMRRLSRLIRLVAPRSTSVLIEGATGAGKELVAAAVHRLSPRAGKPFITLNCAAIPESLLEAELFGHTRGAFTGAVQSRTGRVEAANGGTLFLDEIGEMPLALQAKMLRFLENGEIQRIGGNETVRVDVRIVAATHQPLKQRAAENLFRLDLYHRLAVFPVRVPSLSERIEDIPALARFFLERFGQERPIKHLSASAENVLMQYEWPGNVRELAHVLERATILAEERPEITPDDIWF